MSNKVVIEIESDATTGTLAEYFSNAGKEVSLAKMKHFLSGMMGGQFAASITTSVKNTGVAAASGTIELDTVVAGDAVTIGGVELTCIDPIEVTTIECVDDVTSSLNDTVWTFNSAGDETAYYVWHNVNSAGVDPAIAGKTGIEVAIAEDDTAATIADATRTAITAAASADVTVTGAGIEVILTNTAAGATTNADEGDTGFTVTVDNAGIDQNVETEFVIGADDTETATNLTASINANTDFTNALTATSSEAVITITAAGGASGNLIAMSGDATFTVDALLSGGASDTDVVAEMTLDFGR